MYFISYRGTSTYFTKISLASSTTGGWFCRLVGGVVWRGMDAVITDSFSSSSSCWMLIDYGTASKRNSCAATLYFGLSANPLITNHTVGTSSEIWGKRAS